MVAHGSHDRNGIASNPDCAVPPNSRNRGPHGGGGGGALPSQAQCACRVVPLGVCTGLSVQGVWGGAASEAFPAACGLPASRLLPPACQGEHSVK